ncbi:MAG TPA: hypothetical protein VM221_12510 [Armatimonadota bacterium]|nr:hypothetical protein [Armatimonadota bacterium]
MSDTIVMIAVVFAVLLLISFMLVVRLQSGGASRAAANLLIAELWLTFGVIVALLVAISKTLGPPAAVGLMGGGLRDIGARFVALSAESQWLVGIGGVMAIGLLAHLMYAINRATRCS